MFVDALEANAQDQLQGQIASARIPLNDIASPALYWVLSGNDFSLDINDPEAPKVLCRAAALVGRYTASREPPKDADKQVL